MLYNLFKKQHALIEEGEFDPEIYFRTFPHCQLSDEADEEPMQYWQFDQNEVKVEFSEMEMMSMSEMTSVGANSTLQNKFMFNQNTNNSKKSILPIRTESHKTNAQAENHFTNPQNLRNSRSSNLQQTSHKTFQNQVYNGKKTRKLSGAFSSISTSVYDVPIAGVKASNSQMNIFRGNKQIDFERAQTSTDQLILESSKNQPSVKSRDSIKSVRVIARGHMQSPLHNNQTERYNDIQAQCAIYQTEKGAFIEVNERDGTYHIINEDLEESDDGEGILHSVLGDPQPHQNDTNHYKKMQSVFISTEDLNEAKSPSPNHIRTSSNQQIFPDQKKELLIQQSKDRQSRYNRAFSLQIPDAMVIAEKCVDLIGQGTPSPKSRSQVRLDGPTLESSK